MKSTDACGVDAARGAESISDVLAGFHKKMSAAPRIVRSRSGLEFEIRFPLTYLKCLETYFNVQSFEITYKSNQNQAGYLYAMLGVGVGLLRQHHQQRIVCYPDDKQALVYLQSVVDRTASAEIDYHWRHGRLYGRPEAYLGKSILNFLVERPEKIRW